uniref:Chromodomain helicase DNA binding protein 1-like n=1 Tax=Oryzias melastigma TaxID=30732 RepID=A0A3B3D6C5_ORYME
MSKFLEEIRSSLAGKKKTSVVVQEDLQKWGLRGIQLRGYQLDGVQWLIQNLQNQQGCILGDEMGLGKTCQTISLLVYVAGALGNKGPFLVLSPLSVLENWRKELESFAPCLTVLCYKGDKDKRAEMQQQARSQDFQVLLTTYELCLKDASFLRRAEHPKLKGELLRLSLEIIFLIFIYFPFGQSAVNKGHRVLLFSQMTRMLDILQDYMEYRGYSYERLDGSVRGEERNLAVKNFSTKDIFVFLLSTKAGGVGINLTAADTVIFVDSDFNPQNDLQAAARCHRIGQNRPVKLIRLLARDTVEEIMYSRAVSKLQLTNTVIEDGRFSLLDQAHSAAAGVQLSEILKFGVDKLLSSDESSVQDVNLQNIFGSSRDGCWVDDEDLKAAGDEEEEEEEEKEERPESDELNHMYIFEGVDYSRDPSSDDQKIFERLLEEQLAEIQKAVGEGRALRHKAGVSLSVAVGIPTRKRKPLTEAELELRRKRREEAAAKRAKLQEDLKRKQQAKKMAWWESSGYRSLCLPPVGSEEDEDEEDDSSSGSMDSNSVEIHYVLGDVTHPHAAKGDAIIVHCVDDSGRWGRGGLFTALEVRSDQPRKQYELAGKMKDLELGSVLLFPIDDKQSRLDGQDQLALIVAQRRDKANNLSGILLTALDEGLKKIYVAARRKKASVHLPRIGHSTKAFNWYGTERLIRKHLASRGIPTFIYYYKKVDGKTGAPQTPAASTVDPKPASTSSGNCQTKAQLKSGTELPGFMHGVCVFFYNIPASERKSLARYLITYPFTAFYEEDVLSDNVTHIVAEVENNIHTQELRDLKSRSPEVVPVQKAWLESCFSKQRKVNTAHFLHQL